MPLTATTYDVILDMVEELAHQGGGHHTKLGEQRTYTQLHAYYISEHGPMTTNTIGMGWPQ